MNNLFSRCTFISLIGFILFGFSLSFCQETQQTSTAQKKATATLIVYFEMLVSKNILSIENLKQLCKQDTLTNSISEKEAHSSDEAFVHRRQINQILEKNRDNLLDVGQIQKWATAKIRELEECESVRDEVHVHTQDVHRPMRFVTIPAGKYISAVDHTEFEIPEGLEIQESEVTQWQWTQRLGYNPSPEVKGEDPEIVVIEDQRIKIYADYPVQNFNVDAIEFYIKDLHDENEEYVYSLPSVREYEAILQSLLGSDWLTKLSQTNHCIDRSCAIGGAEYFTLGRQRIWGVIGNVWECTRDKVTMSDNYLARVAFGGSYNTRINATTTIHSILRPVTYSFVPNRAVGFRLVRCKKNRKLQETIYEDTTLSWDQSATVVDDHWNWDDTCKQLIHKDDGVRWMLQNKTRFSQDFQHTLTAIKPYEDDKDLLEYCNHLRISYGKIVDVTPFARLPELRELDLQANDITDLSPLATTRLRALELRFNKIQDITPLRYLTSLKRLDLQSNQIHDISSLSYLADLQKLDLCENKIADISPIAHLVQLEGALELDNNQITRIPSLGGLTKLTEFSASSNKLEDISGLADLVNLQRLTLKNNLITDISSVAKLTNLYDLSLINNQIEDVSSLAHLTSLKILFLGDNKISDIPSLAGLTKLKRLVLNGNKLSDLRFLSQLESLTELELDNNRIRDLTPIGQLTNVIGLKLNDNQISDVTPLGKLNSLEWMELQNNTISDISALTQISSLKNLNLCNNPIKDLKPLKKLKNLIQVDLDMDQTLTLKARKVLGSRVMINIHDLKPKK